jgi:branched-chain amino acid transport system ATP-binding protein
LAPDIITFTNVTAGYGQLTILNELSLAARPGEITLLIGPNGAGKSTVLKTLFGLLTPRSGTIHLHETDITGHSPQSLLRQGIAFVPQGRNLFPSLSVRHNLELGAITLPPADRKPRFEEALARFPHLRERINNQASTLSGGEQKQLEIARALQLRPSILLIDEPSIGLSPLINQHVFTTLRTLADSGTTILMVEQNVRAALSVSDRVLLLESGRLIRDCPAGELLSDPDLNKVFLGKAASK